jgi:hypothetical protein
MTTVSQRDESQRETDRHRDRDRDRERRRRRRRYANKMLPLRVYGLTSSKKKKTMQVEGFEETRKNFCVFPFPFWSCLFSDHQR